MLLMQIYNINRKNQQPGAETNVQIACHESRRSEYICRKAILCIRICPEFQIPQNQVLVTFIWTQTCHSRALWDIQGVPMERNCVHLHRLPAPQLRRTIGWVCRWISRDHYPADLTTMLDKHASDHSFISWMDWYWVTTNCVRGRTGINAAGIYAIRLLKAGCASSAVGSPRPLCDGFRVWLFHIDKNYPEIFLLMLWINHKKKA